jgi:hypothetical protein
MNKGITIFVGIIVTFSALSCSSGAIEKSDVSGLAPKLVWNRTYGGSNDDSISSMAIVNNESIYLAGYSGNFAMLLKLKPDGVLNWSKNWKNGSWGQIRDVTVNGQKDIFLAYVTSDGGGKSIIVRYNEYGNITLWQNWSGSSIWAICATNDSIYTAGNIQGSTSVDTCIARYNLSGSLVWSRNWDSGQYDTINDIAISPDNYTIYGTGITGPQYGAKDVLVIAYDSNGTFLWKKTWGGSKEDSGTCMAVDLDNNVYVGGWTESYAVGISDVLLLKYNPSGDLQWYKTYGPSMYSEAAVGIAIHNDSVYLAGYIDLDARLLKYNLSGDKMWETIWNNTSSQGFSDVIVNKDGDIYVCGGCQNGTNTDIFLVKYIEIPDGSPEFITILLPTITLIAIFIVITKRRRKKDETPRFPQAKP